MAKNSHEKRLAMMLIFFIYCGVFSILVTLSSAVVNFAFATDMYKWVDEDGNTHYTQTPPPGDIEAETIQPPPKVNNKAAKKELQDRQSKLDDLREQRLEAEKQERIAREEEEKRKKNCELAKKRLESYIQPRVQLIQEDGSRVRATEEQRQKELAKSREMIKEFCQ